MSDLKNIQNEKELEKKLAPLFSGLYAKLNKAIKENKGPLTEYKLEAILAGLMGVDFLNKMNEIIKNEVTKSAQLGANRTTFQTRGQKDIKTQYKALDSRVKQLIEQSTFEASNSTLTRLKADLKTTFLKAYEEGKGVQEIAKDLKTQFTYIKDYELKKIARTEINSFHNQGSYLEKVDKNIQYHMWIASGDERVRTSHNAVNRQIVKVGENFSNGLKHPGDKNGPIGEWVNCRCITRAFFIPDGYMAPIGKSFFYEKDLIKKPK